MHKKVDEPQKNVEEEEKSNDFPCWICKNVFRPKSAKELHVKRKNNDKTIQYTLSPTNRKVSHTRKSAQFSLKSLKINIANLSFVKDVWC